MSTLATGQRVAYRRGVGGPHPVEFGTINVLQEHNLQLVVKINGQDRYLWILRREVLGVAFDHTRTAMTQRRWEGHLARLGHLLEGYYPLGEEFPGLVYTCGCPES